jgi:hypothetical protein
MASRDITKKSMSQKWGDYQPTKTMLVWACAGVAAATMVVGFTWGGWVTGGTSRDLATAAGSQARSELVAEICVERFNAQIGSAARLVELNGITSPAARRQFVEAGGWATMPGQSSPDRRGAEACAVALAA